MERRAVDLGTTVAGIRFPFAAMNAAGAFARTAAELRTLARSATGAIVLRTATVHPLVHPDYRSLRNPGSAALLPLVRELAAAAPCPIIASIAGASAEEYAVLARGFAQAGAAMIEADVADPWVVAALAPWDNREARRALFQRLPDAGIPVAVKLPERPGITYAALAGELRAAGLAIVVVRNDFAGLERFLLEAGPGFEAIAVGGIGSGYDVSRALAKGARAVQVDAVTLAREAPAIFARLAREMRIARGERDS